MIAKYKNNYCEIDLSVTPVNIWTYHPIDGFEKGITPQGIVYYEKFVELDEIEEVFDVGFSVCWDGEWCGIFYSAPEELLSLVTDDQDFAIAHGMYEFEYTMFRCALPASMFKEYRMWKSVLHEESTYTMLSYEEFKVLWKLMVADLIPDRP